MKKLCLVIGTLFLVIAFSLGLGRVPPPPAEPPPEFIREVVELNYPDGNVVVGANLENLECLDLINDEFGHLTSGTVFKQYYIHPKPNTWNFEYTNFLIDNAEENGQTIYAHSPIGPQCSIWAKQDYRTSLELETNLREFMTVLARDYSSNFMYLEVVNEAVVNGEWHEAKPGTGWENPWYAIGLDPDGIPSYIRMAFDVAAENADPNTKLGWNHHGLQEESWELILETIIQLKSEGRKIDYVGWQAHVDVGIDLPALIPALKDFIRIIHNLGMDFIITEMDVFIKNGESLEQQAATYKTIVEAVLECRDTGVVGISFWSVSDKCVWQSQWIPGLFDEFENPKPAYYAVFDALMGE